MFDVYGIFSGRWFEKKKKVVGGATWEGLLEI